MKKSKQKDLKENIQLPNTLKEILEKENIIIKFSDKLKESFKGKKFLIQWNITDLEKKYWFKLIDNKFEYGEGEISNPSNIISTPQIYFISYLKEGTLNTRLPIQGNIDSLVLFEEFCSKIFFPRKQPFDLSISENFYSKRFIPGKQPLDLSVNEILKQREQVRKKIEARAREEKRKAKMEQERRRKEEEQMYKSLLKKVQDLRKIYDEIKIDVIEKKLPQEIKENYRVILKKDLTSLLEDMIVKKDISARIRDEFLTFISEGLKKKIPLAKSVVESHHLVAKEIDVLRGGDWKIEDNQSIFYFKVKVKNNSKFVLTNIQILLTSIPSGLIPRSDRYRIDALNPDSFESPTFKFAAKESCVGDSIMGVVTFTDPTGNQQTFSIKPFKIKYVCNLLVPKAISENNYEKNTALMHEKKITIDCNLSPDELEPEVAQILEHNNFYLLETLQDLKSSDFRKLKAYAEGKYDKEDVAVSIIMQRLADQTNKLIIKAMSNKDEKIMDLLKDISNKCDVLKISSESPFPIEVICDNCDNINKVTEYMKTKDSIICEVCGQEKEIPK